MARSDDADLRTAAWTESSQETRREVLRTGSIAGVSVCHSPLMFPSADMAAILGVFPRLEMKARFAEACCRVVTTRPETSSDNFLRDFGERFVPGYKPMSTVDLLMNAPFDE